MPDYRAMVVLQNASALPEDRVVNTWHFQSTEPKSAAPGHIAGSLIDFYNFGGPNSVASFLSNKLNRSANVSEVRVYALADAEPREATVLPWTLGAPEAGAALPNEVAVCLSFYATRNLRRSRGRIYLGPVNDRAVSSGTGDMRVSAAFRAAIQTATERLDNVGGLAVWAVRSHMDNQLKLVTHCWVDDAFDTVRSRGRKPEVRQEWDLATVVG